MIGWHSKTLGWHILDLPHHMEGWHSKTLGWHILDLPHHMEGWYSKSIWRYILDIPQTWKDDRVGLFDDIYWTYNRHGRMIERACLMTYIGHTTYMEGWYSKVWWNILDLPHIWKDDKRRMFDDIYWTYHRYGRMIKGECLMTYIGHTTHMEGWYSKVWWHIVNKPQTW